MRKGLLIACSALGAATTVLGVLGFYNYFSKPVITSEIDLLRKTSSYIREYNGPTLAEALGYAIINLNAVAESGKIPQASDLSKEISRIKEEIGTSQNPDVYKPVLKAEEEKIEKLVRENGRKGGNLFVGIASSLIALGSAGLAIYYSKKDDDY